ncbi:hypothetical protein CK203_035740 [Vitis vinifera]|uniref:Uncharacterized protein n=1 Tax=Vitis vinifera TaxID=29760 RepID=A0A438ICP8_VITVI|nr:hypothetical protein CK203_035740 [Vitis vinifera]
MVSSAVKAEEDLENIKPRIVVRNREKVYERYNVRGSDKSSVSGQAARRSEGGTSPSSRL